MATITVALAYLNGDITETKDGTYVTVVKEPISYKDKHTGEYKKKCDIKYKLMIPKHRMPEVLLEHGNFLTRKEKGISISICFTGALQGILTNEEGGGTTKDARVKEAQNVVSFYSTDHAIGFVKAMQFNSNAIKNAHDDEDDDGEFIF